jgi:hypothetical protein
MAFHPCIDESRKADHLIIHVDVESRMSDALRRAFPGFLAKTARDAPRFRQQIAVTVTPSTKKERLASSPSSLIKGTV